MARYFLQRQIGGIVVGTYFTRSIRKGKKGAYSLSKTHTLTSLPERERKLFESKRTGIVYSLLFVYPHI